MDIRDTYVAYCFDEVVNYFGNYVESELEEAAEGSKNEKQARIKQERQLDKVLGLDPVQNKRFRNPIPG